MNTSRIIAGTVALGALFVASLLDDSLLKDGLRYLATGFISVDLFLRTRSGYLRRRPHWTPTSWRRFLVASSVPASALLLMIGMMVAFELRLPIVGAARSTARGIWAVGTMLCMVLGVGGLVLGVELLAQGDPERQFELPRWLTRGPRAAA